VSSKLSWRHRVRALLARQCTATDNATRSLLSEFDVVARKGTGPPSRRFPMRRVRPSGVCLTKIDDLGLRLHTWRGRSSLGTDQRTQPAAGWPPRREW
jgi:hypothetical protein